MGTTREQLSIRLPHELMESIDQRALNRNWTRTNVIEDALLREFGFPGLPWSGADASGGLGELRDRIERLERLAESQGASL